MLGSARGGRQAALADVRTGKDVRVTRKQLQRRIVHELYKHKSAHTVSRRFAMTKSSYGPSPGVRHCFRSIRRSAPKSTPRRKCSVGSFAQIGDRVLRKLIVATDILHNQLCCNGASAQPKYEAFEDLRLIPPRLKKQILYKKRVF